MNALGIFLLFAGCLTAVSTTEVTVQISSSQVTPGDDVTVQCTLSGYQVGQYINWYKRQDTDDLAVIGTAFEIVGDFVATQRYSLDQRQEGDDVHFILHIRGVTNADSGDIGCAMGQISTSEKIFASLTVTYPPSEIKLFSMMDSVDSKKVGNEYNDGDRVKFKDGESLYFQCKTSDSNPPADFEMSLGERIYTSYFEKTATKVLRGGTPGLREIYYDTVATTVQAVNMTAEASEQKFTCTATVHNYEATSISITPYITLAPKVECPKEVVVALHARDVKFSCTVTSSETLTDVMWMYYHHDGSSSILRDKEEKGHYLSMITQQNEEASATLQIDMVSQTSFRDYTVMANNSVGSSKASVSLRRDLTKESTQGAGSLRAGATLLMLATIISYLYL